MQLNLGLSPPFDSSSSPVFHAVFMLKNALFFTLVLPPSAHDLNAKFFLLKKLCEIQRVEMLGKFWLSTSIICHTFSLPGNAPCAVVVVGVPRQHERHLAGRKAFDLPRCYPRLYGGFTDLMSSIYVSKAQHRAKRSDTRDRSSFGEVTAKLNDDRWKC